MHSSNLDILLKTLRMFDKYKEKYEEVTEYVRLDIKIQESTISHAVCSF